MNHFCSLPFRSLMTFNTGEAKPCCDALSMGSQSRQSLSDIWNGDSWKDLRRSMIQDQQPAACQVCWNKEQKGFLSGRETLFDRESLLRHCSKDGTMKTGPRAISLRLGNKCNLACIMCSPLNSSLWSLEEDLYKKHMGSQELSSVAELDIQDEEFLNILKDIESITFIGGEPLLFKQHEQILKNLIASGKAPNIELHYFTNTTVLPQWCLDMWRQFRRIKLRSSVDGVDSIYNYIRYPADWTTIEKNVSKLSQARLTNLDYSFCYVLMNLNVFSLEEMFKWRNHFFANTEKPLIKPDYIEEPDFLRPHHLPAPIKEKAVASLSRTLESALPEEKKLITDMREQILFESPDKEQKLAQLGRYLVDIDKSRKTNHALLWNWIQEV